MVGIASYGTYIPWHRMERGLLANAWGSFTMPGEKAVANFSLMVDSSASGILSEHLVSG